MNIKSANPAFKMADDVTIGEVMDAVTDMMPAIEERFMRRGHRQIRISLFVESMDPLAPVAQSAEIPTSMIPLYTKRLVD